MRRNRLSKSMHEALEFHTNPAWNGVERRVRSDLRTRLDALPVRSTDPAFRQSRPQTA